MTGQRAEPRGTPVGKLTAEPMVGSASARKLREAGNEHVELFVSDGMPHGFYFFPRLSHQEEETYDVAWGFLKKHLA